MLAPVRSRGCVASRQGGMETAYLESQVRILDGVGADDRRARVLLPQALAARGEAGRMRCGT